jgi:hypothetical protein
MGLADELLAGLQLDHAHTQRGTDHHRQTGSVRVQDATIAADRGLIVLRHPLVADLNCVLSRFR